MNLKTIYITILFLFNINLTVAQNNTISPKNGEIVFIKQGVIEDNDIYKASLKRFGDKFANAMKKQILKERQILNKHTDNIELEQQLNLFKNSIGKLFFNETYSSEKEEEYFIFRDSLIISYKKINDKIIDDYRIINRNKKIFYYLSKVDSITTYYNNTPYKQYGSFYDLKEFRDTKKTISGYDCFKITYKKKEIIEKDVFELVTEKTMYVTEEINLPYHPILYNKAILNKYYPLEITEKNLDIDGAKVQYSIKRIEFKN